MMWLASPVYQNRFRRSGITLLEIMFSIGIVGIGLIGVAALIPLAHHKAAQGIQEDRKTLFGKRAFREFRVRGMDIADNIIDQTAVLPNPDPSWRFRPFCIDPIAYEVGENYRDFPFARGPVDVSIPRKTLSSGRNWIPPNAPHLALMSQEQAQSVFELRDDLEVTLEQLDNQKVPQLSYLDGVKTTAGNSYSWMAFVVPHINSPMTTVSIVVFYRRRFDPDSDSLLEEITAEVSQSFLTGAIKSARLTSDMSVDEFDLSKMKSGDWIMIAPPGNPSAILRWYRVLMADVIDDVPPEYVVDVALEGPDWVTPPQGLRAAYARGVVTVYEKTVRAKGSTLYDY